MRWTFGFCLIISGSALAGELPRYRFEPGQILTYRLERDGYKDSDGKQHSYRTLNKVIVVKGDGEGGWWLLFEQQRSHLIEGKVAEGKPDVDFGFARISPSGVLPHNPTISHIIQPRQLLPLMPENAEQLGGTWSESFGEFGDRVHYRMKGNEGESKLLHIEGRWTWPVDEVYERDVRHTYTFDPGRGFVTTVQTATKFYHGPPGKYVNLCEGVEQLPAEALTLLGQEWERVRTAWLHCAETETDAALVQKQLTPAWREAIEALRKVGDEVRSPILKERVAKAVETSERNLRWMDEDRLAKKVWIGLPSPSWEVTDFDGKKVALKELRGKVVLLDFWYRGCLWCVRAMPQVNQLAEDFKDQPVVILGMNIDEKEADARIVMEKMRLKYPTLKAEGVPQKYRISGYPTLILIDQEGVIREMVFGHSPNLREQLGKKIRELLAK